MKGRLGVVYPEPLKSGGQLQYRRTMLKQLGLLRASGRIEDIVLLMRHGEKRLALDGEGWDVRPLPRPNKGTAIRQVARRFLPAAAKRRLKRHDPLTPRPPQPSLSDIDVFLFPAPSLEAALTKAPSVVAIHDLQHRLQPEFPEVSLFGEWLARERYYRASILRASAVLVDSDVGKKDLLEFYEGYGLAPERIFVLPFLPPPYLTDAPSEPLPAGIPREFFFYPAQFWPHKNHARIIQAVEHIKRLHGRDAHIVFCGSSSGSLRREHHRLIMDMIGETGLSSQVHFLGYVPDALMSTLYRNAIALLMPTMFGPTNIPVVEAWQQGCPVITSDIRGIREQAGDAAVLADPRSTSAIADAMLRVWNDAELRRTLVARGHERLKGYGPEEYARRLHAAIEFAVESPAPHARNRER